MVEALICKNLNDCLLALAKKSYRIVAGGTDMLIQNRSHTSMPIGFKQDIIYINLIDELQKIDSDKDYVYIGACARLEKIMEYFDTPQLLKDTILEMASPAIRHTATLAGNIANASPAGDSLVSLYLLDAELEIRSLENTRRVFLKDFITGVRRISLNQDELITKIIIPKIDFTKVYFRKVGPRLSDAISKISFTGGYVVEEDIIKDFRMAFGAVNTTVVRNRDLEKKLIGKNVCEIVQFYPAIISWYDSLIIPIDDQRSNKEYRKEVAFNLIKEFLLEIK